MNLSSVNVDVLLYLMGFVEPVDRFNLVLSGILKGFENVNEGIDLRQRVEYCEAELGLRCGGMCELEIRSLKFKRLPDESLFRSLERLAEEGYLQNNRELIVTFDCSCSSRFVELICSMKNLEKLNLYDSDLTLEVLARVFQSCSKLIGVNIMSTDDETLQMPEHLKNQLRLSFQRLRYFDFQCFIDKDSWPVIQEMLTWLKECEEFTIFNENDGKGVANLVVDGSLTLDPNLAESLQISNFRRAPAALAKWFLSVCTNIHSIELEFESPEPPISFHNEIGRLKKLKKLNIWVDDARELKEIVRSCRQVEILGMDIYRLILRDLAELEPTENITDITLLWHGGPCLKEVLPVLKSWRHVCRLTVVDYPENIAEVPFEELGDFIMGMKHLSHLHFVPQSDDHYKWKSQLEFLLDKFRELILPQRPNFKFDISRISVM